MALVLDWQKKLGYRWDPFEQRIPRPVKKYLIGTHDLQERLNLFLIKGEQFGTVSGEHGSGKTMLLRWIEEELAPQRTHTQQYTDAKDGELLQALSARKTLLQRVFSRGPQDPRDALLSRLAKERRVILIDNAGSLRKEDLELLHDILQKTPSTIMLADTADRLKRLDLPGEDRLKAALPTYTHADLAELLRRRIEAAGSSGTFPFDAEELERLFKKADANPAKLLHAARERAIELSLKVTRRPAQPQTPGKGLLSIKIEKASQYERTHPTQVKAVRPEEERLDRDIAVLAGDDPEKELVLPPEQEMEADMLAKIVQGKPKKTAADKTIQQIAKSMKKSKKKR